MTLTAAFLQQWAEAFAHNDEDSLASLVTQLGFAENRKTATNLLQLHQYGSHPAVLADLACQARASADGDRALNNLERLAGHLPEVERATLWAATESRPALLAILGASPFLTNILCRRPALYRPLFLEKTLLQPISESELLAGLRLAVTDTVNFTELQKGLRLFKQETILRIAARDLAGLANLSETAAALADLASATLQRAWEICDILLRAEHGRPLLDEPDEESGDVEGQFVVLGMGKLGGRELNFSSDIDLIYFYSSERGQTTGIPDGNGAMANRLPLHQYFVKLGELITRAMSTPTEDGFVFRVDLNLRPEGRSGEMANSLNSAELYYESWGQSWERTALLKGRPVAGSMAFGERLLQRLEPFIYRKFLDYTMIEDLKVMKQKIDRSLVREREGERNLKLGRGGIREIEFFIQAMQMIHAGRHPALRERNSLRALALLRREGLIDEATFRTLTEAYIFLRTTEHRLQLEQERQTHNLPLDAGDLQRLGRCCGFADHEGFRRALDEHRLGVTAIYHDLFYTAEEEEAEVRREVRWLLDPKTDADLAKDILEEQGFRNPDAAYENLMVLRDGPPRGHLAPRARRMLERIAPQLLQEVLDCPEPDMALGNLERFLSGLRARATFYALLAENPAISRLLVTLFGTSQFLSRNLIQHPEILDALVSRASAASRQERGAMEKHLDQMLSRAEDYEDQLDALRRFRNEEFLRLALNDLHGNVPPGESPRQLTMVAETSLNRAMELARQELLPRYGLPYCEDEAGRPHEAAFAIIGMGKLGGRELTYHSDLDIIFIYEGEGQTRPVAGTDPERFRQRTNQEYFARLAQRIISILTLITREGYVYQIDTRLRPSGNQGPLVTSLPAYGRYHEASAQLWERQALVKARVVAGPEPLAGRIAALNRRITYERPLPADHRAEIFRLRQRMEQEIARESAGLLNIKTGRGGLVDVEFLVQYLQLLHGADHPELQTPNTLEALKALLHAGLLSKTDYRLLASGYQFLRRLENRLRLVHDQSISELRDDRASLLKLARRLGYRETRADERLRRDYHTVTENIRAIFNRILG